MSTANQILTNQQRGEPPDKSWGQWLADYRAQNLAKLPNFGAELASVGREMVNDLRNGIHQGYFGVPEGGREPGTPMAPPIQEVAQSRGTIHSSWNASLDTFAAYEPKQQKGMDL